MAVAEFGNDHTYVLQKGSATPEMVKGLYWLLDVAIRKPEVPDITSNVVSRCFGRTPNIAVTMTILSEKHTTSKAAVAEDPCRNENFPP